MINPKSFVGKLRYDSFEFLEGDSITQGSFLTDMSAVQHFKQIIIIDTFFNPFSHFFELFIVNHSVFILIKKIKDSFKAIFCFGISHFCSNGIQEFIKVDWLIFVSQTLDYREDEGISLIDSELLKSFIDFSGINRTTTIFIKNVECGIEFLVILRGKSFFPTKSFGWSWGRGFDLRSAH